MEGNALVKQLTGAQVYVMKGDDEVIATGAYKRWPACKVDRVLNDGDKVTLGGVSLTAVWTPGHTRGCTTWTMQAADRGETYEVVIVGSPNVNPGYQLVNNVYYPEISSHFAETFRVLKSLRCDIFLGAHGNYYGMEEKFKRWKGDADAANPFIDPEGYKAYVADREQHYLRVRAEQSR
jgi:metallo-beta-lactamase class B